MKQANLDVLVTGITKDKDGVKQFICAFCKSSEYIVPDRFKKEDGNYLYCCWDCKEEIIGWAHRLIN